MGREGEVTPEAVERSSGSSPVATSTTATAATATKTEPRRIDMSSVIDEATREALDKMNRAEENPRVMPGGARIVLGERYAALPGQAGTMDLFIPATGSGPFPVVMWTSGSGWTSDQGNVGGESVASYLLAQGYAVASFSVRSSDQAVFPAQVHDAKAAVRWVRANAGRFGLDPDRIAASGNSSGGWIATMLGVTGGHPQLEGTVGVQGPSSHVDAVVNFFAPTDFLQINRHMIPGACEEFNRAHRLEWCLPKGHVEAGETLVETAVREVAEETGIHSRPVLTLGTIDYWFSTPERRIHKRVHHYLLEAIGGYLTIDNDPDHEAVACASFEDVFAAVASGEAELAMIPIDNSIAGRVAEAGLERTALILVGPALGDTGAAESALYSAGYDRRFRPTGGGR